MKKWYHEEYEFQIEVIGFLRGDHTEQYCRNGEEIGDPVNAAGQGICSKVMMILFSIMEAVRSGGDLGNIAETANTARMSYAPTVVSYSGLRQRKLK